MDTLTWRQRSHGMLAIEGPPQYYAVHRFEDFSKTYDLMPLPKDGYNVCRTDQDGNTITLEKGPVSLAKAKAIAQADFDGL
jgi:hypothetical protein